MDQPNFNLRKWYKPYKIRLDGAINLAPGILDLARLKPGDELEVAINTLSGEIILKKVEKK